MDEKIYCKNCVYSLNNISNICTFPAILAFKYMDKDFDIIETLRVLEKAYYTTSKDDVKDFNLHLYLKSKKEPSIQNYLLYVLYEVMQYSSLKDQLFNHSDFSRVYGISKEELVDSVLKSKYVYGEPLILNAENKCPLFVNSSKGLNGIKGLTLAKEENKSKDVNKLKYLITFFTIGALIFILLKLILTL